MKDLLAKYRALALLCLLALVGAGAVSVQGCGPSINPGAKAALDAAKAAGPAPIKVLDKPTGKVRFGAQGRPAIGWVFNPKTGLVTDLYSGEHTFAATGDNPAGWLIDPTTGALTA